MQSDHRDRRRFLKAAAGLGGGMLLGVCAGMGRRQRTQGTEEEGVSADEDLMREHGILRRTLLAYEATIRRMEQGQPPDLPAIHQGAIIIRDFIENYHEKDEERFIFPLFGKDPAMAPLVAVLLRQHQVGREVTARLLHLASDAAATMPADQRQGDLRVRMLQFIAMYRPHAVREDTVLFPAVHGAMDAKAYDRLGERLEKSERDTFGHDGFEEYVAKVAALERRAGHRRSRCVYADYLTLGYLQTEVPLADNQGMMVDLHTHIWQYPDHIGKVFAAEASLAAGRTIESNPSLQITPEVHWKAYTGSAAAHVAVLAFRSRYLGVNVPNEHVAAYVRQHPDRLLGFACVDPADDDPVGELEHAVRDLKLKGLKLAPVYQNFHPMDPRAQPLYHAAQRLGIPILFHQGATSIRSAG